MDVYEAIEKRRTIRVFKRGASKEILRKIVLSGTRAMSARNCQPWEFIIVNDPKLIEQIAEQKFQMNSKISLQKLKQEYGEDASKEGISKTAQGQKNAYENCSVVAICHKKGFEQAVSTWCCIQNMALAATAEGLGVVPSTFSSGWGGHKEAVEKLLCIPEGYELATVLLIGVQGPSTGEKLPNLPQRREFSWLHENRFNPDVIVVKRL